MTDQVTLVKDATTIQINGPLGNSELTAFPKYVTDQAADGTRYTYKTSSTNLYQWRLRFENLTFAMKRLLDDFFNDDADGPINTFTYTHTDGRAYTVRFVDTSLVFTRPTANNWATSVTLETSDEVH